MTQKKNIYLGSQPLNKISADVAGSDVELGGESFYKISNVDGMRPFFMSLVSHSDHWMFISSSGGLTAGRKNSNYALFPYYTDDKITESNETTGSKTVIIVSRDGRDQLWEPFSSNCSGVYQTTRNLYKNAYGNKLVFEEINHDLACAFKVEWNTSDKFGFVRRSRLENLGEATHFDVLDGIQNILPYGVPEGLQSGTSNLVDAYKRSELEPSSGIGIFALSAIIVDRAEPSEALKANTVWSLGLPGAKRLVSSKQLAAFRSGAGVEEEHDVKAERGAYFLQDGFSLASGESKHWLMVAEVNQNVAAIAELKRAMQNPDRLEQEVMADIQQGSVELVKLVASADGLQLTSDRIINNRHFANTMFNIMRGGIFDFNYTIEKSDFKAYLKNANKKVAKAHKDAVDALPELFTLGHVEKLVSQSTDDHFIRLCKEYLPLKFSRRHGDPSRPWNKFSINMRNEEDGSKLLDYEGNWRDIFQNWEALAHSYPAFIEGMIYKFLNASTFDGYNPYRVMKGGIDWETIEPDDPWSYIGYWGDHQIIYLLKFLEFAQDYYPGKLKGYMTSSHFVYANVPYRIKPYEKLLLNPKDTIEFDLEAHELIEKRRSKLGADGALLRGPGKELHRVNFVEKLLATVLAKLSNYIPEGGIWMNTQRPEWNDANNALVGNGVSMVTLYYLRRFLAFAEEAFDGVDEQVSISKELHGFFVEMAQAFTQFEAHLNAPFSDADRKKMMDALGQPASEYRTQIYEEGFSGDFEAISLADVRAFFASARKHLEFSIRANKREDGLYHAYNLMTVVGKSEVAISYLPEMLEGQVSVLSAKYLSTEEALSVLDALKASALFREDQYSYILYPNKELPRFLQKNIIPKEDVEKSNLLQTLLAHGNRQIINRDCEGNYHFNGSFNNAGVLRQALDNLPSRYHAAVIAERQAMLDLFEKVFNHKAFTGRSGTFFGYEGLGSIYWHMVSKLLLAAYEVTQSALDQNVAPELKGRLYDHYFEILAGIGAHKPPKLYGAFPTDPYSHTPGGKGAQQPGMTGQVKEDLLARYGELGIRVLEGKLTFDPEILRTEEFLSEPASFRYYDVEGDAQELPMAAGSLAFTVCQVPVVYERASAPAIQATFADGTTQQWAGSTLNAETTREIFNRSGRVVALKVQIVK